MRSVQLLDGRWELIIGTEEASIGANIPGSVCAALLEEGRLEDPYWRDNEKYVMPIMENDFLFTRIFKVNDAVKECPEKLLSFEGIDTLAEIFLNGVLLGRAENMHRRYEFSVTDVLREGENELQVRIFSPTKFIREAYEKCPVDGAQDAMKGFPHIRKAHCMFGWDWGARIPDAGIFRSVSLIGYAYGLIDSVQVLQFHENGRVRLRLEPETRYLSAGEHAEFLYTVTAPDGKIYRPAAGKNAEDRSASAGSNGDSLPLCAGENTAEITIEDPELWWPNGYGEHPLYTVSVQMLVNGKLADC